MATLIEWKQNPEPLLISVSRTSGSSVLRNRWKRLVKEWFYSEGQQNIPGQNIWIRFNRTKTLKKPLLYKDWAPQFTSEALRLKAKLQ
ncbi:MAG: ribonuclease P protein component [Bdellovibrionota bacterium]